MMFCCSVCMALRLPTNNKICFFDKLIFHRVLSHAPKCASGDDFMDVRRLLFRFGKLIRINVTKDSIRIMAREKRVSLCAINRPLDIG